MKNWQKWKFFFFIHIYIITDILITENCTINFYNKIPQNKDIFFKIKAHETWNNSIAITFKINENIDLFNLFFIIKSYTLTNFYTPYAICMMYKLENKIKVMEKEYIDKIKNMEYDYFEKWINYRIYNDWKYEENELNDEYTIIIQFTKTSIDRRDNELKKKTIELLKPIYPWTPLFLDSYKNKIETTKLLEKKIKAIEDQNEKLLKKIKILKRHRHINERRFNKQLFKRKKLNNIRL